MIIPLLQQKSQNPSVEKQQNAHPEPDHSQQQKPQSAIDSDCSGKPLNVNGIEPGKEHPASASQQTSREAPPVEDRPSGGAPIQKRKADAQRQCRKQQPQSGSTLLKEAQQQAEGKQRQKQDQAKHTPAQGRRPLMEHMIYPFHQRTASFSGRPEYSKAGQRARHDRSVIPQYLKQRSQNRAQGRRNKLQSRKQPCRIRERNQQRQRRSKGQQQIKAGRGRIKRRLTALKWQQNGTKRVPNSHIPFHFLCFLLDKYGLI